MNTINYPSGGGVYGEHDDNLLDELAAEEKKKGDDEDEEDIIEGVPPLEEIPEMEKEEKGSD